MFGFNRILFLIILCLVPAFLLALFYIDSGFREKTSSHFLRFSDYLKCDNGPRILNLPKPTIEPFFYENPSCACQNEKISANRYVSSDELEDLQKRRLTEYKQHQIRTGKHQDFLLLAPSNTPLQYPIRGFRVLPRNKTLIPGLAVQTQIRDHYQVSLRVGKGVLSVMDVKDGEDVDGQNEGNLNISSTSIEKLNELLSRVTYTSTVYHIKTQDLAYFTFENHEVIFPIEIRRPSVPVLYDPGKDINSQVTILVKAFLRYKQLKVLITSIRVNYPNIKIIIADDSPEPEKIDGENIEQYFMPPTQGWFAGRNLAVSQVTTKYFLWVDDDFVFLNETRIERFVEIMEAVPELDVVGGQVLGNRFAFKFNYEEGNSEEGGCLKRIRGTHGPVPGLKGCSFADGVVNYFMGRTDAVRRVGFDPFLKRVAHSEFFMDGLGKLLVATCGGLKIGHQNHVSTGNYKRFRYPPKADGLSKITHHYFKNHLKCIYY